MSEVGVETEEVGKQAVNLDSAVAEVFELMMGVECVPESCEQGLNSSHLVTAVVGLAGALSGACILRMEQPAALSMAGKLLGMPIETWDETVNDALGEVSNMLAGAWKSRLPEISASCMLSVPAVVSGTNYQLHMQKPDFRLDRSYRFGHEVFSFSIVCDGL